MKKLIVLLLSSLWVLPLFLAIYLNLTFIENEVSPLVYGQETQLNSFPYISTAKQMLAVSVFMFISTLLAWSVYFVKQK